MANKRSPELTGVIRRIQEASEARQRHWNRITRSAPHDFPYRLDRIHALTVELEDLYAEKRQLLCG